MPSMLAARVLLRLVNGGRRLIQVTDNGCGMSPRMPRWRCKRFTTSKIRSIDDLPTLATLGFRGEALPSIAAVAEVEMVTRPEQPEGVLVRSHTSGAPQVHAIGCPVGTRVRVQRLFSHVPVRLRALKSVAREVQLMQELVAHYALAHPQVTLHMQHEGRRLLFAPATTDLRTPGRYLWSGTGAAQMLPVSWQSLDLGIQGAVSPPSIASRYTAAAVLLGEWSASAESPGERCPGESVRRATASGAPSCGSAGDHSVAHPPGCEHPPPQNRNKIPARARHLCGCSGSSRDGGAAPGACHLPWEEAADTAAWQAITVPALHVGEAEAPYDLRAVAEEPLCSL